MVSSVSKRGGFQKDRRAGWFGAVKVLNGCSRVKSRLSNVGLQAVLQKLHKIRDKNVDRLVNMRSNNDRHTGNTAFCEPMSSHIPQTPSHKTRTVDVENAKMDELQIWQSQNLRDVKADCGKSAEKLSV